MNKFGYRLRELRESKHLLLRQLAAHLNSDTAYVSKLERGERRAKREQVTQLSSLLDCSNDELMSLWLADQVYNIVKDEKMAYQAIEIVKLELK